MSFEHPNAVEELFDRLVSHTLIRSFYQEYVHSLQLNGVEHVLELGAGTGAVSRHLAELLQQDGGSLTCLDTSADRLNIAQKYLQHDSHVTFKVGDVLSAELQDGAYDAVVIHFMLHDIESKDRQSTVQKLANLLKPGGKLFIREPTKISHGIPPEEICRVMEQGGLQHLAGERSKRLFIGKMYSGVFVKPE